MLASMAHSGAPSPFAMYPEASMFSEIELKAQHAHALLAVSTQIVASVPSSFRTKWAETCDFACANQAIAPAYSPSQL